MAINKFIYNRSDGIPTPVFYDWSHSVRLINDLYLLEHFATSLISCLRDKDTCMDHAPLSPYLEETLDTLKIDCHVHAERFNALSDMPIRSYMIHLNHLESQLFACIRSTVAEILLYAKDQGVLWFHRYGLLPYRNDTTRYSIRDLYQSMSFIGSLESNIVGLYVQQIVINYCRNSILQSDV